MTLDNDEFESIAKQIAQLKDYKRIASLIFSGAQLHDPSFNTEAFIARCEEIRNGPLLEDLEAGKTYVNKKGDSIQIRNADESDWVEAWWVTLGYTFFDQEYRAYRSRGKMGHSSGGSELNLVSLAS